MGKKVEKYDFIDLFAGIGGFRVALESLGHHCVFSSEWDKEAQNVYYNNFHDRPEGDITKIKESDIPSHDVLCAGFPCQPFSISGKQKGFDDTRGNLFFDIARIAKYHQPKYLFLENVANFLEHDGGKTMKTILNILRKINYSNIYYDVLNASFFGVPQARKRLYIIAVRNDLDVGSFEIPKGNLIPITLKDILMPNSETKHLIVRRSDIHITNYPILKPNKDGFYPLKPIRVGFVNKGGQGERIYHPLGHAITLSAYGGGAGAKTGLYYVNGKVRKLHPEECKLLMAFPDKYKIHSNSYQAYKQFGNSVVVKVIEKIFHQLMESIECQRKNKMQKSETRKKEVLRESSSITRTQLA